MVTCNSAGDYWGGGLWPCPEIALSMNSEQGPEMQPPIKAQVMPGPQKGKRAVGQIIGTHVVGE